ncbi:hypothetical protein AB8O38_18470 [Saccharomonospora xinjiangensis]|uniref:hypothetical protein n=1 Tax=Saccharomonospora xinjiangensis TaxID=75294 RepID=UPI00350F2962
MASETSAAQPQPSTAGEPVAGTPGMWSMYFGQPAPPQGGVNWDAYSHEELYQMLWQDADVADVSTIAAEWADHRAALINHAEVLREQRAALLESWEGTGAEEAARRLDVLAARVEKIAELAMAGEQAAAQSAEALARARAMMPPPSGQGASPMDAVTNWADVTGGSPSSPVPAPQPRSWSQPAGLFDVPDWRSTVPDFLTSGSGTDEVRTSSRSTSEAQTTAPSSASDSDPAGSFGAVGGATFSFYAGAGMTDFQKQQAIRAMQTYESSLTRSGELIGQAQGTIPAAATLPSSVSEGTTRGTEAGTRSWQSLTGSGSSAAGRGLAAGAAVGALAGGVMAGAGAGLGFAAGAGPLAGMGLAPGQLAQGLRVGAMAMQSGQAATAAQLAAESAAARAGAMGGMVPPGAATRGQTEDEEHENQLPTIDQQLFPVEEPGSEVVIGLSPEEHL